ncbi:MAG: cytochrome c biogenesis protein CcsA [Planctomycetota bacterium]|jgi:ABC-type uncharacterized transport system permease subunit
MLGLPMPEIIVFLSAVLIHLVAAIVGILQLLSGGRKYKRFLSPLVSVAVALEVIILIFRAVALKAIPLTGLFESMIVLTIVFGLIYLFFSIAIGQVWFGSVMAWVILTMIVLAGIVAKPVAEPDAIAATPWAIAHGIAMILGGASITFAAASAFLSLLGSRKLKRKEVMQVLGKVPNIEKLERMNLLGVRVGFVLLTIGLISGLGLASKPGIGIVAWLADGKVICSIAAWVLLGIILVLSRMLLLKDKMRAYITVVAFVLVLFAILGVTVLGATQHDFTR